MTLPCGKGTSKPSAPPGSAVTATRIRFADDWTERYAKLKVHGVLSRFSGQILAPRCKPPPSDYPFLSIALPA
jgi:hypothetical protein